MIKTELRIKSNNQLAANTWEMTLELPAEAKAGAAADTAAKAAFAEIRPGQFINIALDGFYLRRPISICSWTDNTITIIYKTVGAGTEAMTALKEGAALDVLLPLGNGYSATAREAGTRPVLIGGGAGVPPMYGLCERLIGEGVVPAVVLGFRTAEEIFYIDEFEKLGATVIVATEDGSQGVKGFVTDVLADLDYTSFYACGPEGMLKAIDNTAKAGLPGWMSFEERMGCGFGACMGCSCQTKYGNKRICKDGPVLEREEIIW